VHKKLFIGIIGLFLSGTVAAQFGGKKSYQFLSLPPSARLAALGGVNVSLADRDVNFFFSNPALVSDSLSGVASAGYTFYVADIGQSVFTYSHDFKKLGAVSFGVQHLGYGTITGYDDTGLETGSYSSAETALVISKSHQISIFRMGASIKFVSSSIAGFRSNAMLLDVGGIFVHPEKDLTVGLVIKNFGFVVSEYSTTSATEIPFDVQAGVTFKPEHMPVRASLTVYNLTSFGDVYDDPNESEDNTSGMKKVMQHLAFGAEILIHKNVNVLLGYNVLKQQELKTQNTNGGGFTAGASIKIKTFDLAISRSSYSIGNAAWTFTLAADINKMFFKKSTL
jgi:hypothetical protein